MLTFRCRILTETGEISHTTITGENRDEIENSILSGGAQILSMTRVSNLKLDRNELLLFTQTLKTLLDSHLSLRDVLVLSRKSFKKEKLKHLTDTLLRALEAGETLSSILQRNLKSINTLYIGLIKVGEQSGNLNSVLSELTKYLEREKKYRDNINSAMVYPIFIIVVTLLFSLLFVNKILPEFSIMFSSLGGSVKDFSKRADILAAVIYILVTLLLSVILIIKQNGRLLLALPVIGGLILKNETFKLLFALSILSKNSLDLISSLKESRSVLKNRALQYELDEIIESTVKGERLSVSFNKSSFPHRVATFISIGEESGNISTIFHDLSNYYSEINHRTLEKLMSMIDPIFTLIIGVGLTLIIVTFVLPLMTQMGTLL